MEVSGPSDECLSVFHHSLPNKTGKQRQTVVDLLPALFLFIRFSLHYSAGSVDAHHVSSVPSPVRPALRRGRANGGIQGGLQQSEQLAPALSHRR